MRTNNSIVYDSQIPINRNEKNPDKEFPGVNPKITPKIIPIANIIRYITILGIFIVT